MRSKDPTADTSETPTKVMDLEALASLSGPAAVTRRSAPTAESLEALAGLEAPTFSAAAVTAVRQREFLSRLGEEVSRAERGISLVSVVLVRLHQGGEPPQSEQDVRVSITAIDRLLRHYDICCRVATDRVGVILPGTTAAGCAHTIERVRRAVAARTPIDSAIGGATWLPTDHGIEPLLMRAERDLGRDRGVRRVPSLPPPLPNTARVVLWPEGLGHAIAASAQQIEEGLTIDLPLPFARVGAAVHLRGPDNYRFTGVVDHSEIQRRESPTISLRLVQR